MSGKLQGGVGAGVMMGEGWGQMEVTSSRRLGIKGLKQSREMAEMPETPQVCTDASEKG